MARTVNRLTAAGVRAAKKRGHIHDGAGLYLRISASGTKSWVLRYTIDGRTRDLGLGTFPGISLAGARELAEEARKKVQAGVDPIEERRKARRAARAERANAQTFDEVAAQYIAKFSVKWSNDKHAQQWANTLRDYASPVFGNVPVAEIDKRLVLEALEPIWNTKRVTAERLRKRIEKVLDFAAANDLRADDNPARWGLLQHLLPGHGRDRPDHLPAMDYRRLPAFMAILRAGDDVPAKALEFCILTAARTSEVIGAVWDEIDFDAAVWTLPPERMKGRRKHRVPLAERPLEILHEMAAIRQSEYVFPGARKKRPLGGSAMLYRLRQAGEPVAVIHGFRSAFRSWAAEQTDCPREIAEAALAHRVGDATEQAYQRADYFKQRRELMEKWARHCAG